jgi:hypothetical protein
VQEEEEEEEEDDEKEEVAGAQKLATSSPAPASPLTPNRGTRGSSGRRVRAIKMEEEEDSEGEEAGHEDDDYQPMEEEEAEDDNEEDVDNRKRRTKRRNATGGDDGDEDSDDDDVKPVLVKHKKEERMELQEERTQVTLGEGEAVTRDSVGALAFKRGGSQRTKEERAERLREVLGRPALALIPEAGDATEADVPAKAGGKGGKAGQVLFREKHRHWIAEANQKDAQGRSRDDPAYDPSTLFIPRKVAASIHRLLLLGSFLLCGDDDDDDDLTSPRSGRIWRG